MKFYIASSRDGLQDVLWLRDRLLGTGHTCTFDWTEHIDHRCGTDSCGVPEGQLAHVEVRAAAEADWFFGIHRMGKGAHVETGAALAAHSLGVNAYSRVVLVGVDTADSPFYRHGAVTVVPTREEAWREVTRDCDAYSDIFYR